MLCRASLASLTALSRTPTVNSGRPLRCSANSNNCTAQPQQPWQPSTAVVLRHTSSLSGPTSIYTNNACLKIRYTRKSIAHLCTHEHCTLCTHKPCALCTHKHHAPINEWYSLQNGHKDQTMSSIILEGLYQFYIQVRWIILKVSQLFIFNLEGQNRLILR